MNSLFDVPEKFAGRSLRSLQPLDQDRAEFVWLSPVDREYRFPDFGGLDGNTQSAMGIAAADGGGGTVPGIRNDINRVRIFDAEIVSSSISFRTKLSEPNPSNLINIQKCRPRAISQGSVSVVILPHQIVQSEISEKYLRCRLNRDEFRLN
jgi:hypothetical protein